MKRKKNKPRFRRHRPSPSRDKDKQQACCFGAQRQFFKNIYQKTESLVEQDLIPFSLSLAKEDCNKFGKERTLIAIIN